MDLEMPFMNGLTCVRRIREMQREGQLLGYISIIAILRMLGASRSPLRSIKECTRW